jgi:hypothetical protein
MQRRGFLTKFLAAVGLGAAGRTVRDGLAKAPARFRCRLVLVLPIEVARRLTADGQALGPTEHWCKLLFLPVGVAERGGLRPAFLGRFEIGPVNPAIAGRLEVGREYDFNLELRPRNTCSGTDAEMVAALGFQPQLFDAAGRG